MDSEPDCPPFVEKKVKKNYKTVWHCDKCNIDIVCSSKIRHIKSNFHNGIEIPKKNNIHACIEPNCNYTSKRAIDVKRHKKIHIIKRLAA